MILLEWDEAKRGSNLQKHGIDFADLLEVFENETASRVDDRFDYEEDRLLTLGFFKATCWQFLIPRWRVAETLLSGSSRHERRKNMNKNTTSKKYGTDLERLRNMKDEDIDFSDIPRTTPEFWANGVVRKGLRPSFRKQQITLRIDRDVLEFLKAEGEGYQTKINTLLRSYMDACKSAQPR